MDLKLYDTLTREKRPFKPIDDKRVRLYVCGPTVYDFAHIGNARPVIVFDVLYRLLRHLYGESHVTYVRNITDVDDKINARAAEEYPNRPLNEAIRIVTEKTEKQFHEDVAALGCLRPDHQPRATEYISRHDAPTDMVRLIGQLIASDHAYVAEGHVLFDVSSMPDYGKLARRSLDEMIAGARVEVAPYKRNPMDFVLWKPSKPGEPSWPSPWSNGRPGWHIECSAMSAALLGETFDIHGGGIDLVFPHHENEIAQSRCAFHTNVMANFWMHNGFLQVEGEKMSKSLGNFITINELLNTETFGGRRWSGEVLRLAMLMTQYRQPIDWTVNSLNEAQHVLFDWRRSVSRVDVRNVSIGPSTKVAGKLLDDLGTSEAIHELHELAKVAQKDLKSCDELYANLVFLGLIPDQLALAKRGFETIKQTYHLPNLLDARTVSGYFENIEWQKLAVTLPSSANSTGTISTITQLLTNEPIRPIFLTEWVKYNPTYLSEADRRFVEATIGIENLNHQIEQRLNARQRKDYSESDRIRNELASKRIVLKDSKDGSTWEVAR